MKFSEVIPFLTFAIGEIISMMLIDLPVLLKMASIINKVKCL